MKPFENFQKLYLIAHKYYIEGKTQHEIAKELRINRVLVSRYLKQAREQGIVQIKLVGELSEVTSLKDKLVRTFSLKNAEVVPISFHADHAGDASASLMAEKLDKYIKDGTTIGIGWGTTIERVAMHLHASNILKDSTFVALTGGTNRLPSYFQTNNLVKYFADAYGARAKYLFTPFVFEDALKKKTALLSKDVSEVVKTWEKLDVIISGIGCYVSKSPLFQNNVLDGRYLKELIANNVVGDVLTHFFDDDSKFVNLEIYERMMNIPISNYLKTDLRIGIAAGFEKVQAIFGALTGRIVNVLITDAYTAELLLKYHSEHYE